jgi:hypothetical protein
VARKARIPRPLRERVARMAGYRCGYCRTPENIAGFRLSIEHIIPEAKGGQTVEGSSGWHAMHAMNSRARTHPCTGSSHRETCPIVEPAASEVARSFFGSEDGTEILGLTPCGRATIAGLQLSRAELVAARSLWVQVGWWPPRSDFMG